MKIALSTLVARIAERYDPDYLVDVLDISSEELLEVFMDKVKEKRNEGEFSEVEDDEC